MAHFTRQRNRHVITLSPVALHDIRAYLGVGIDYEELC